MNVTISALNSNILLTMLLIPGEKPNLHPIMRVLLRFPKKGGSYQCRPFPWTTELGIWTIQIGHSYGGAIHPCIFIHTVNVT